MLRKRIIFTLIHSDGFFMQSRNFRLQKVGDTNWLERNYKFREIASSLDELVVLDATKESKSITKFAQTVSRLVNNVFIPISAGGGIRSIEDAELLFHSGADKIVLNSILYEDVTVVQELIKRYGAQSIVASIDYKVIENIPVVFINDGNTRIKYDLPSYLAYVQKLNVGEIYLNSIDKDGTGFGYDLDTIKQASILVNVPLIIAGGAGSAVHLQTGLKLPDVSAVATANLFNFMGNGLPNARRKILEEGENIANWT